MKFGEPRPSGRLISLTPLIDVVFILLVFFMLASSYLDWRAVDLTVSSGKGSGKTPQQSLVVRLKADGTQQLGGEAVNLQRLRARVAEALAGSIDQRVVILSEREVPLQRAVDMLDLLKASGAANVSLSRER